MPGLFGARARGILDSCAKHLPENFSSRHASFRSLLPLCWSFKMKIKFGVISSDSHGQLHKDAFTSRMSKAKFGDRIPQLVETTDKAHMSDPMDRVVERWRIN